MIKNQANIPIDYSNYTVPSKRSKEDAWALLNQQIEANTVPKRKVVKLNWLYGAAAAAAVFFAIMYMGMFNTGKYSPEIYAGLSICDSIYLPDSSLVALNSNSFFKYNYNKFSGERNIVLKGEAFFEVTKGRKFLVDFEGGKVEVHGTSFNVMAYSKDYLQIDCTEGNVDFVYGNHVINLQKGQGAKLFKSQLTGPYSIDANRVADRLSGLYYWNKVNVEELMIFIGYRFGYTVHVDQAIENRNFSGKIDLANLQNGLSIVSYAMELRYSIDEQSKTIQINAR